MVDTVGFEGGDRKQVARRSRANRIGGGPYSRRIAKGLLSGNSADGRYVSHIRHDLTKQIGGEPTFTQRLLIEQTAIVALRLARIAEWIEDGKVLTQMDNNQAIAWHNCFRRNLVALGLEGTAAPAPRRRTVEDVRAEVAAMAGAAA